MKSGQKGLIHRIDVIDRPVTRDAKKNLMDELNVVILPSQQNLAPNTSLLSSQFTMFLGYEALDYTIGINNKKGHLRGRIVFEDVAGKLYSVHALYGTRVDEEDFGKFISSFQLIQK